MQNAILTGSYAYGHPTKDSDIDIAIRADWIDAQEIKRILRDMGAASHVFEQDDGPSVSQTCEHSVSVRIGKVNLIVCSRDESFQLWVDGTEILRNARPVTRDHAISVFDRLRKERGL